MKLGYFLRDIILEQATRLEVLVDKYVKKKKDPETGKTIQPLLTLDELAEIILADPTTAKPEGFDESDHSVENLSRTHPGSYTNWMIRRYENPGKFGDERDEIPKDSPQYANTLKEYRRLFMEDLFKVTGDLKKFDKYKQYFPQEMRDINKFTPTTLFKFLDEFSLPERVQSKLEKTELKKEIRKEREGFKHPGATVDFTGNNWTVIKISDSGAKGQEAASWYGGYYDYDQGESRWCTSTPGSTYFKSYVKDGPLYVILSNDETKPVGKRTGLPQLRYQFHFPSNQFMDRADHRIELVDFLNGPAAELKEYFKPEFAKGMTTAGGKKVEIEYPSSSASKFIALYGFEDFFASLPNNITNLLFNNKSSESLALDIPPTLGRFTELEALLFINCVKTMPNELGNLKKLMFLSLMDNKELKTIPDAVLTLPSLVFVNLKGSTPQLSDKFLSIFKEEGPRGSGFYTKE